MDVGDEDSFGVKYKLRHFSRFRILVAVTVLLGLLLLVFVVLFAVVKLQNNKSVKDRKAVISVPCNTKDCVYASVDILNQINQSADPCDDFFAYACGGYITRNPLKDGQTARSSYSDTADKNIEVLKKSLETATTKYRKNEAVMKAFKVYSSCLDELQVDAKGDKPLKDIIKKYGGWDVLANITDSGLNVTGNITNSTRNTWDLLADVERDLAIKPLFNVMVSVDLYDSSAHIIQFGPAEVGMTKTFYTGNSAENIKVQNAYKKYMKTIAKLLGGPADSDKKMMEVYELEAKLAEIENKKGGSSITEALKESASAAAASGDTPGDIRISIIDFANQTATSLDDMIKFLNRVFQDQKKKFKPEDRIIAYPISYFVQVHALFAEQFKSNPTVIDNYIMWTLVNHLVPSISSNYTKPWHAYQDVLTGLPTDSRWKMCIKGMQSYLSMAMGFLFVESAFDEQTKKAIEGMSKYLRSAFSEGLQSNDWMSPETKVQARKKVQAMKEDIGYPPYIKDPKRLAAEYSELQITGDTFKNALSLRKFYSKQNLDLLGKAVDKGKWLQSPSQVNGYYNALQNRIVFLAGILQPPFYNPIYPKYLTFGGIGTVIGHEITHGFDTTGDLFDKDGNLKTWMSPQSSTNFNKKIQCLALQYSKYKVFGENIDGNQTLNENIADNGGMELAYKAYLDWAKENGTEKPLPGIGLSVDQLFFVGFARPWCSIYTKGAALIQLRTGSHTYEKYRVIGTLSNFPKFSEAFKCKPGSPMNPASKCSVW